MSLMAGADRNIEMNAGNLNVPVEVRREPSTTIAGPELKLVATDDGALDIGAVFSQSAEMMASSEFFNAWALATAILLERNEKDTEDAAVTTTEAAGDDSTEMSQLTSC